MKLVIVTGLSGSGKSIALNTLEDLGYYCVDNLPLFLLSKFVEEMATKNNPLFDMIAVGIDARNRATYLDSLESLLKRLSEQGVDYELIYLEAQDDILIKRYSETRRRHPLSDDDHPLAEAIKLERQILGPFLNATDLRIDTTRTNVHQLRDLLRAHFSGSDTPTLSLLFLSFGFKHGVPKDADFIFDARFLPNPHWQQTLRPLTGRDHKVAEFLEQNQSVLEFKQDIIQFLERWIPGFQADGRSYLTIAIGCTGGQHRSVYLTEQLAAHFKTSGLPVIKRHRELA
jgi:UPF0042 nucleotide-binding protein